MQAHPVVDDKGRKKLCSLINCQNLTPEACVHATRNDRLSAEMMVQVLYYEQQRLREIVASSSRLNLLPDDLPSLQKENQDLKFELLKMKMRLKDVENSYTDKSTSRRRSFISTVSRKLAKFTPFLWSDQGASPSSTRSSSKLSKYRRHSIS